MKTLVMLSAAFFVSIGTAQACELQKRFLLGQISKPISGIARELKGKDVVAVKRVERSARCDFAVQTEWTTDDGDLVECYTQVRVERSGSSKLVIKFLGTDQRTTCFL
jgi:hypothetical protein